MPAWVDITLVKALARAFRWRKLLETGRYIEIDTVMMYRAWLKYHLVLPHGDFDRLNNRLHSIPNSHRLDRSVDPKVVSGYRRARHS